MPKAKNPTSPTSAHDSSISYDDGTIVCGKNGIVIKDYYFPSLRERRISWSEIESFRSRPMGFISGRLRIWGMGFRPEWFNLDVRRPFKHTAIELNTGSPLKPVITPQDPERVMTIINQKIGSRASQKASATRAKSNQQTKQK